MSDHVEVGRFSGVDKSGLAAILIGFLDFFERIAGMPQLRQDSFRMLGDVESKLVVDLGCGTGTAVAELRQLGARSVGIDPSDHMLALATQRHPEETFQQAAAESLPFADGEVDALRAERVFQHVVEPSAGLSEVYRVLAPGGRLVGIDFDVGMWVADSDVDQEVTAALARGFASTIASPWIGRRYRSLLLDAGFTEVAVTLRPFVFTSFASVAPLLLGMANATVVNGFAETSRVEHWVADQRARSERDRMFVAVPMFVASGTKPS